MSTQQTTAVVLEAAAQQFADATSTPPFIYELGPDKAREVLEDVQRSPIDKPDVDIEELTITAGPQPDSRAPHQARRRGHNAARHPLRPRGRLGARQP
jgi:hypothetical protein